MTDALKSLKSVKGKKHYKAARNKFIYKPCSKEIKEWHKPLSKEINEWLESAHTPQMCSDAIFLIFTLLPMEDILRLKSVCRDWARVISDPLFIQALCTRPGPITSFFSQCKHWYLAQSCLFNPFQSSPKFPSMITVLLSSGFKATSTSHGLVCFIRGKDEVIILANPATSHWALIPRPTLLKDDDGFYCNILPLIIYDPTLSLHFKLTIPKYRLAGGLSRFQIYSSETSSWTLSSVCPYDFEISEYWIGADLYVFKESMIGGGSVCFLDGSFNNPNCVCYEISSDTYQMFPLPKSDRERVTLRCCLLARDGEIYHVAFYRESKTVVVRRLDENKSWVLEGEGNTQNFPTFPRLPLLGYDSVRKALILNIYEKGLYAFHLSSSTIEFLGEDYFLNEDYCGFSQAWLPHANTLASFHGGKQDSHALDQLLHQ